MNSKNKDYFKYPSFGLTMGRLRKFLENNIDIPDEAPVMIERVEDFYFTPYIDSEGVTAREGWAVLLREGESYWNAFYRNKEMEDEINRRDKGEFHYPDLEDPSKFIVKDLDKLKEQFHLGFCIVSDKNKDVVYIYNHY